MKLQLQSVCEVYRTPSGVRLYLEVNQDGARWTAVNGFNRNIFCGNAVSRRSALITIRKQVGHEIALVCMAGTRTTRKVV